MSKVMKLYQLLFLGARQHNSIYPLVSPGEIGETFEFDLTSVSLEEIDRAIETSSQYQQLSKKDLKDQEDAPEDRLDSPRIFTLYETKDYQNLVDFLAFCKQKLSQQHADLFEITLDYFATRNSSATDQQSRDLSILRKMFLQLGAHLAENNKLDKVKVELLLQQAVCNSDWDIVADLTKLSGDNKPGPALANSALILAAADGRSWETVYTLASLSGQDKPSQASISLALEWASNGLGIKPALWEQFDLSSHRKLKSREEIIQFLLGLSGENQPTQHAVNYTLNQAISNKTWGIAYTVIRLTGTNQPSQDAINQILKTYYDRVPVDVLKALVTLPGNNKPDTQTIDKILKETAHKKRWLTVLFLAQLESTNKPTTSTIETVLSEVAMQNELYQLKEIFSPNNANRPNQSSIHFLLSQATPFFFVNDTKKKMQFTLLISLASIQVANDTLTQLKTMKLPGSAEIKFVEAILSYKEIYQMQNGTSLDKAAAILRDYTKNNSVFSRFFHGNWNRHHIREVTEIINQIGSQITTVPQLLTQLEQIHLKNPNGTLSERIQFISANTFKEPNQPDAQLTSTLRF